MFTYTVTDAAGGTATATVTDAAGGTATATVTVTVEPPPNLPPVGVDDEATTFWLGRIVSAVMMLEESTGPGTPSGSVPMSSRGTVGPSTSRRKTEELETWVTGSVKRA